MNKNSKRDVKSLDSRTSSDTKSRWKSRVENIRKALAHRGKELLFYVGIAAPDSANKQIHCPFPDHDDHNPSWRWEDRRGRWYCTCGQGDIYDAVGRIKGLSFTETVEFIETEFLNKEPAAIAQKNLKRTGDAVPNASRRPDDPPSAPESADIPIEFDTAHAFGETNRAHPHDREEDEKTNTEKVRERAEKLWSEGKDLTGTLGQTYFEAHRGIVADWANLSHVVRFHPRMRCTERNGYHPAILFRVSASPDGELMTIHRVFLSETGGKAPIQRPKKAYGDFLGGAIWFGRPGGEIDLVKAEGPENGLVCFIAGRPLVAACVGGANMKNVAAPDGIKRILIAGDRGRGTGKAKAGEDYAEEAAIADRGRKLGVLIAYPPARPKANGKWEDWNDLHISDGPDAVRAALSDYETFDDLPAGFRRMENGKGIEFLSKIGKDEDGEEAEQWQWLCSEIKFLATTLNAESKDWGLFLEIKTKNAVWHKITIPTTDLVTSSEDIYKNLTFHGLEFSQDGKARRKLKDLLLRHRARSYAICVPKIGFHDGVYVLPNETIGDTQGRAVVFQPHKPVEHAYRKGGTLKGWQDSIAVYARGNDRLLFALAAAFAPPLLEPMGMEGGGFHFRGGSTAGKTTILKAAGTVWGGGGQYGFIRSWKTTDNALEAVAAIHNHAFLPLDEIAEIEPKALFRSAYALVNGRQKERMQKTTDLRAAVTWRLIFMSTGEIGLAEKLAEDRLRITGGQSVRLVELNADAGQKMGMFQTLHGFSEPKLLADALNANSLVNYGHAAPAFIGHFIKNRDHLTTSTNAFIKRFRSIVCPLDCDAQVTRVADRFGLVAAAGEIATSAGITPWKPGEARDACKRLFHEWITTRGTAGPIEVSNGLTQVRLFIELHGASRFTSWSHPEHPTINRVGFWRVVDEGTDDEHTVYYILPEGWKEICRGFDSGFISSELARLGILRPDNHGKMQRAVRLPQMGKRRVYEINGALLSSDEDKPQSQVNGHKLNGTGQHLTALSERFLT